MIEADLHDCYGIDIADDDLMERRTWRWLQVRIAGLLSRPPAYLALGMGEHLAAIPSTRIGYALNPPDFGA